MNAIYRPGTPGQSIEIAATGTTVAALVGDASLVVDRCDVCGGLDALKGLIRRRVARTLSAAERERYIVG